MILSGVFPDKIVYQQGLLDPSSNSLPFRPICGILPFLRGHMQGKSASLRGTAAMGLHLASSGRDAALPWRDAALPWRANALPRGCGRSGWGCRFVRIAVRVVLHMRFRVRCPGCPPHAVQSRVIVAAAGV